MLGLNNMQDKSCYWRTMQDMLKDPQDHKKSGFDRDCGCSLLKDYSGSEAHDLRGVKLGDGLYLLSNRDFYKI